MINHVLSVDGFYFSTTYDLTHTLQRLSNTSPEFQEMSLLERVSLIVRYFYLFGVFFLRDIPISSVKIYIDFSESWLYQDYVWSFENLPCFRYMSIPNLGPQSVCYTDRIENHDVGSQKCSINTHIGNPLALGVLQSYRY